MSEPVGRIVHLTEAQWEVLDELTKYDARDDRIVTYNEVIELALAQYMHHLVEIIEQRKMVAHGKLLA